MYIQYVRGPCGDHIMYIYRYEGHGIADQAHSEYTYPRLIRVCTSTLYDLDDDDLLD